MTIRLTAAQAREFGIDPQVKRGKKQKPDGMTGSDKLFDAACAAQGLPIPDHEYRWHPTRKWKFDYLWNGWLAAEKVGGVWIRGHHSRGQSQIDDFERMNEAVIMGYSVLQFTPQQFDSGEAFAVIRRALEAGE